jgi:RNA polymerase sigma-70 factor (ECF subfamily)
MSFAPQFRETRWTQVRRAKLDSPEGRQALSELCQAYYEPVTAFLRRTLPAPDPDAALELSHAFFAKLLAGGAIARANEDQGRFRSYLLGALKHFVARHRCRTGWASTAGASRPGPTVARRSLRPAMGADCASAGNGVSAAGMHPRGARRIL